MENQLELKKIISQHWHPWMDVNCNCRACDARRELEMFFAMPRAWSPWEIGFVKFLASILCKDIADIHGSIPRTIRGLAQN